IFFGGPMLFNISVALYTFVTEIERNDEFNTWFKSCPVLSSIITLLSAADLTSCLLLLLLLLTIFQIFGLLRSKVFGCKLFTSIITYDVIPLIYSMQCPSLWSKTERKNLVISISSKWDFEIG